MNYYISINGAQRGPFPLEQLAAQGLRPDSMVWTEGMPQWEPANRVPALQPIVAALPAAAPPLPYAPTAAYAAPQQFSQGMDYPAGSPKDKKLVAGLCGIFLGTFGIHKFVMGYTTAGIIMLCCSLTCVGAPIMHLIGLIEGIMYLAANDEEFYRKYMLQRHDWF